jgi:hypothetical protein
MSVAALDIDGINDVTNMSVAVLDIHGINDVTMTYNATTPPGVQPAVAVTKDGYYFTPRHGALRTTDSAAYPGF